MSDSPLTSNASAKIFTFALFNLLAILCFGIGLIPSLFVLVGLHLMRKKQDFSYLTSFTNFAKVYSFLVFLTMLILYLNQTSINEWLEDLKQGNDDAFSILVVLIPLLYYLSFDFLFYKHLKKHQNWVVENFKLPWLGAKKDSLPSSDDMPSKHGNESQTSLLADQLEKLARLKNENLISESEYQKAKTKLLGIE
jgi:hypothetical protein